MKACKSAAAIAAALVIGMVTGCGDRPSEPNKSPGPGAGVPQPKTAGKAGPASAGSSGQTASGGATGQANEGSLSESSPKRPASKQ